MKTFIFLLFSILMPLVSVSQTLSEETFTIKVDSKNLDKTARIYLLYKNDGRNIIDSADQKDELYTFNGKIDQPRFASMVTLPANINIFYLLENEKEFPDVDVIQFYIHPGVIELRTDSLITDARFIGSPINDDYFRLQELLKPIDDGLQVISLELVITKDSQRVADLRKQYDSLKVAKRPLLKAFVQGNPESFIALTSLKEYAGSFPDVSEIEPMFLQLSASVRNTVTAKEFHKFLMDRQNLTTGALAPDFIQNDTSGRPVSLSSFRGKYVLLDFWASWCGPCRDANPTLRKIYQQFHDKNFTILGVSLDDIERKNSWLKAIKQDSLLWTQVSDLKHWENQVVKLYGVKAIPQNFLIDPKGVIVARGLSTEELEEKLNQLLLE